MQHSPDESALTPDQRRHAIAVILARGILRLYTSGQFRGGAAELLASSDSWV